MKRLALLLALAGCSVALSCGGSGAIHTMTGAFATCAKGDLGQIVASSGLPLLSDISAKIEGNGASLEADLAALATVVGIDAVKCAIVAVEAVITQQPTNAGSGSGSAIGPKLAAAKPPGLERALVWSKAQK